MFANPDLKLFFQNKFTGPKIYKVNIKLCDLSFIIRF